MAVFLLLIGSFRVKTGLKNSYAPRSRISGIFERTHDLKPCFTNVQTQIGQGNYCNSSFLYDGNDVVFFQ